MGYIFGADHTVLTSLFHRDAAEAAEGCAGKLAAETGDDLGTVVVARSFTGGEEDARMACGCDRASLNARAIDSAD